MANARKPKPTKATKIDIPKDMSELSPKERAQHGIALCHNLIFTGTFPGSRCAEVQACLTFLETLHKQNAVSSDVDEVVTPSAEMPGVDA